MNIHMIPIEQKNNIIDDVSENIKTTRETCIIVPSHINNINRTKLLICCLKSLINQSKKIQIYLSISFETDLDETLFKKLVEKNNLLNNTLLCIIYQETQTSQFRHIEKVINNIKHIYKYIMFCDDDDTYENFRVEKFISMIECGISNCTKDKIFAGVYERDLEKGSHSSSFYEYWSYCVNIEVIINFMNIIKNNNYDYYIDNKMCDVLFATYLRCLDNKHFFVSVYEKLYNYNRNQYSITQKILKKNDSTTKIILEKVNNFEIFIEEMNNHLEKNFEDIKTNIFIMYSMGKNSFENILKEILKKNYKYKNEISKKILKQIKNEYDNIKCLCDILYQYK
jgi:hypothetical protein